MVKSQLVTRCSSLQANQKIFLVDHCLPPSVLSSPPAAWRGNKLPSLAVLPTPSSPFRPPAAKLPPPIEASRPLPPGPQSQAATKPSSWSSRPQGLLLPFSQKKVSFYRGKARHPLRPNSSLLINLVVLRARFMWRSFRDSVDFVFCWLESPLGRVYLKGDFYSARKLLWEMESEIFDCRHKCSNPSGLLRCGDEMPK
jgi:hypothetical protein